MCMMPRSRDHFWLDVGSKRLVIFCIVESFVFVFNLNDYEEHRLDKEDPDCKPTQL